MKPLTSILCVTTLHATLLAGYSQGELDSFGVCKDVVYRLKYMPIYLASPATITV